MSGTDSARDVAAAPASSAQQAPLTRPEAIVVRARSADALAGVESLAGSLGYAVRRRVELPPSLFVELPPGVTLARAVGDFTGRTGVLYAEPAFPFTVADFPADPLFSSHQRAYLDRMFAPPAWDLSTGHPGVIVAVLDTGLDVGHPDLQGRVWTNGREVPGNAVDDDGNGCADDVHGCTFLVAPDASCAALPAGAVTDDVGHGTFVAGIIAASGDGRGTVGIARNTTVLPVKILDCTGGGNTFALAQGILYAVQHGARIINVSLGGPVDSAYVREAIRIARADYGALLVAATGNAETVSYPAKYEEVLAVGGATSSGQDRAPYSAAGPEVDVAAIGEDIVSTVPGTACGRFNCLEEHPGYATGSGTSFAAPMVAGQAALMLARNPFLPPDAVAGIIRNTADAVSAGDRPGWAGAGRINMLRSLQLPFRVGAPGSTRN